jgi:hypothetical protein
MNSSRSLIVALALIVAIALGLLWRKKETAHGSPPPLPTPAASSAPPFSAVVRTTSSAETPVPAGSPIANDLNAPTGTIAADLKILQELFFAYQSNFPRLGNPVGENAEITAVLLGENPAKFPFIARNHRALNARGELCDRWGTPFRFHQLSGSQMEVRSAGPDRKFGTPDDAQLAPDGTVVK